jgi:hypothetical protein
MHMEANARTIQCDTNLTTVSGLEFFSVDLHRRSVSDKDVVADDPGLARTVAHGTLGTVAGSARGELAHIVSEHTAAPGLIESNPVLHFRAESIEHYAGIVGKIGNKFFLVQKTTVALVKRIRKIPVEEGNERSNTRREQVVDELDIVLEALFIDGIIPATERDDTRPAFL